MKNIIVTFLKEQVIEQILKSLNYYFLTLSPFHNFVMIISAYHQYQDLLFFKNITVLYLFLTVLGLCCCAGFSLIVASGGYSLVAVLRCLIVVASIVGHVFQGSWAPAVVAPGLQSTDSVGVVHGLSYCTACEIISDQGSNLRLLHWQVDTSPLSYKGSPNRICF